MEQGDYAQAAAQSQEGLEIARQLGRHRLLCGALQVCGDFSLKQQQWTEAAAAFGEMRDIASGVNQGTWQWLLMAWLV